MKQFSLSYLATIVPLLGTRMCQANPTLSTVNVTTIVPRAQSDSLSLPPFYNESGVPEAEDIWNMAIYQSYSNYNMELAVFANILWGFAKCNPNWVKDWFANDTEQATLEKQTGTLEADQRYMLRYNKDDNKRHSVVVSREWRNLTYLNEEDQVFATSMYGSYGIKPWWPWGLLQGVYNGSKMGLDTVEVIMALSGETLRRLTPDHVDQYWDLFVQADKTPVWTRSPGGRNWNVVMRTNGTGREDGWVFFEAMGAGGKSPGAIKFSQFSTTYPNQQVYFLDGQPDYGEGKRKGETKY